MDLTHEHVVLTCAVIDPSDAPPSNGFEFEVLAKIVSTAQSYAPSL